MLADGLGHELDHLGVVGGDDRSVVRVGVGIVEGPQGGVEGVVSSCTGRWRRPSALAATCPG